MNEALKLSSSWQIGFGSFAIALAVHVALLFGLRVELPVIGNWSRRPALLWITQPQTRRADVWQSPIEESVPGVMRCRGPELTDGAQVVRSLLEKGARATMPVICPVRPAAWTRVAHRQRQSAPARKRRRWRVKVEGPIVGLLKDGWEDQLEIESSKLETRNSKSKTVRPALFSVAILLPGGQRAISVVQSSGDARFDDAAAEMIERLPIDTWSSAPRPDQPGAPRVLQSWVAVSLEAASL